MRNKAPYGAFKIVMQTRKKTRELIMKVLYQMDIRNEYEDFDYQIHLDDIKRNSERDYFINVVTSFIANKDIIDQNIADAITSRSMKKIGKIEFALLRLASVEIDYIDDIPVEVSVNEAIELSKIYATEKSYIFINGVLGRYIENKEQIDS